MRVLLVPPCGFNFTHSSTISFHFLQITNEWGVVHELYLVLTEATMLPNMTTLLISAKKIRKNYICLSIETWQEASPIAERHWKDASATDSRASRCQSPTGIKIKQPL